MANPFVIAAALAHETRKVTCPYCKHVKTVAAKPAAFRTCPRCKRHFPDPLAKRRR